MRLANVAKERLTSVRRRLLLTGAALLVVAAIAPDPANAAFPGGNGRIAFTTQGDASHSNERHGLLHTIEADGTGLTTLTNFAASPEWSADGSKIVFERGSCFCNPHIAVINADGSGETPVTNTTDLFWELEPTWSPDNQIAYTRAPNPPSGTCRGLWIVASDGSGAHEILAPEQGPCYKKQPAWSPDGSLIAFSGAPTVGDVPTEIYAVRPDGTDLRQVTNSPSNSSSQADWSPNGAEIAYHFAIPSPPGIGGWMFELRIMRADGSNDRFLRRAGIASVNINHQVMVPAWSPNGTLIAFETIESGFEGLYAVKPDGTGLRPIYTGFPRGRRDPDWQRVAPPAPPDPADCNGVFVAVTVHDLTVQKDRSCTLIDSTVTGRVRVEENAYFEADDTDIAGKITANKSLGVFIHTHSFAGNGIEADRTARVRVIDSFVTEGSVGVDRATELVEVCGTTVAGSIAVRDSGPAIRIGDPQTGDCDGNTVGDDIVVKDNSVDTRFEVRGNSIAGDMGVLKNRGAAGKFVTGNTGGGTLRCTKNDQPFFAFTNPAWETRLGQCSGP